MAKQNFHSNKQKLFILIARSIIFISLVSSCTTISVPKKAPNSNPLIERYKQMRMNKWRSYTKRKETKISINKNKKKEKASSISIEHLKNNPIFQQVVQIHCFKIRASSSRCEAIRYLP